MKNKIVQFLLFTLIWGNILPTQAESKCPIMKYENGKFQIEQKQNKEPAKMNQPANILSKSEFSISAIDPTVETNKIGAYYPGFRGGNQLIVYTPKFGNATETNEFGSEAIVVNNVVTELSGSNSNIPPNGFVISGHGKAKNWINENLIEGAFIKINQQNNIIESITTPESYVFRTNSKIEQVKALLGIYKKEIPEYSATKSEKLLAEAIKINEQANSYIADMVYDKVEILSAQAASLADRALYNAVPAKQNEFHGVWLRPTEKNQKEISESLDKLKNAGIENVFVETYYQGYTIFPSSTLASYGLLPQRKEFSGWDPLKTWIEEAHKKNMKVHVWFQTFYVGNEDISKNPNHILSLHPEWANIQKRNYNADKPMPSTSEHNGYFLDPANPEVQKYLLTLIDEISSKYAIDGINIDYIRYPASLSFKFPNYAESTWGYSNFARTEFKNSFGVDPAELTVNDPLWQQWVTYRQNKVTSLVSCLKNVLKDKTVLISAVVFPDLTESKIYKNQDWETWGTSGMVDAFTPLVLGSNAELAKEYVGQMRRLTNNNVQVIPGLFQPFTLGSPADLLLQISSARQAGASGIILFDKAHFAEKYIEALNARAFSK